MKGGEPVKRRFLFAVTTLMVLVLASRSLSGGSSRDISDDLERYQGFELSVNQMFDEEGASILIVGVVIPYRRLVFFRKGDLFEARYRVYMDLNDSEGNHVRGEVWEETIKTDNYRETTSASSVSRSRREFPIEPGEFDARIIVEVIDTSLRFQQERSIRIVGREEGRLELSDPIFLVPERGSGGNKPPRGEVVFSICSSSYEDGLRINPHAVYEGLNMWTRVTYNVSGNEGAESRGYLVSTRIRDHSKHLMLYSRESLTETDGVQFLLCLDLNIDNFPIGGYEISTVIEIPGTKERVMSQGSFTVLLNRGLLAEHFEETLDLLSIIADEKELEELAQVPFEERLNAWIRFWKRRDPTPSTEINEEFREFLRRLSYVLKSFSRRHPGWQTDRGRIYIRHGAPDRIVERPGRMLGSNYELWYYFSMGVVYIFEDAQGLGEYKLLTTQPI